MYKINKFNILTNILNFLHLYWSCLEVSKEDFEKNSD